MQKKLRYVIYFQLSVSGKWMTTIDRFSWTDNGPRYSRGRTYNKTTISSYQRLVSLIRKQNEKGNGYVLPWATLMGNWTFFAYDPAPLLGVER